VELQLSEVSSFLWLGAVELLLLFWAGQSVIVSCSSFMCHVCVIFPLPARRSLLFSLRLLGESANCVWNFRGVCHCRDVARGSDRMIRLCSSWVLLSLSNVVPYGVPLSVEIRFSSMSCTLVPHNPCTMVRFLPVPWYPIAYNWFNGCHLIVLSWSDRRLSLALAVV